MTLLAGSLGAGGRLTGLRHARRTGRQGQQVGGHFLLGLAGSGSSSGVASRFLARSQPRRAPGRAPAGREAWHGQEAPPPAGDASCAGTAGAPQGPQASVRQTIQQPHGLRACLRPSLRRHSWAQETQLCMPQGLGWDLALHRPLGKQDRPQTSLGTTLAGGLPQDLIATLLRIRHHINTGNIWLQAQNAGQT